jgi:hypothetical protein
MLRRHYAGMFFLSLATLLLELSLTRVISVANWYHFGFLVISTALLGFGAAGVTLALWPGLRDRARLDDSLAWISLSFGAVALVGFWLMQRIPFQPFYMLLDRTQVLYTMLYYLVLAAPFFCAGLGISLLLSRGSGEVNRLYAADLLGAGLGCAAIRLVMPALGGSGSVAFAGALGVLAALTFKAFRPSMVTATGSGLAAALLVLAFVGDRALPIAVFQEKHHPLQPVGQEPLISRWNTFSKIDVYEYPGQPERGWPDPGFSVIIDAGASGTAIPDLSAGVRNYLAQSPGYRPAGLAYIGKSRPKVLIIGSGAGREVLEGLYYQASSITAVEINPIINDIVSKDMAKQWGGLFQQPEVHLVTEDGRSFVRRSKETFDAIISIQTMSDAALASGAASFGETYVLTQEAFDDYWNHLTPTGTLLITRPTYQIPKLFATTRRLFESRGLGSPAEHMFAFRGTAAPFGHRQFLTGFLLQKSPLRREQVDTMAARLGVGRDEVWSDTGKPEVYYSPFGAPENDFQRTLVDLVTAPDLDRALAQSTELIYPATDDQPFFNRRVRWSSLGKQAIWTVLGAGTQGNIEAQPVAEVTLLMLLFQTLIVALVMIVLPLFRLGRDRRVERGGRLSFLTYFAGLGLGFILIEIVMLQRFALFLGQPVYTLSVVLAGLLVSTGIGSYLANRNRMLNRGALPRALIAVLAGIVFTLVATPAVLSATLGLALPFRVAIAILLITPMGILLGVPFPSGLRLFAKEGSVLVTWAWAINGFFTVVGSVLAMILGMTLGFRMVLLVASACYLAALIATRALTTQRVLVGRTADPPASIRAPGLADA